MRKARVIGLIVMFVGSLALMAVGAFEPELRTFYMVSGALSAAICTLNLYFELRTPKHYGRMMTIGR